MSKSAYYSIQVLFALLSIVVIGWYINPHMDEYIQFNALSYLKPIFKYNTYNDGYDQYVVYLLGHVKYRMSYSYIGNTSSVLYYPFYKLLPYSISNNVYSIVFLGLFCWLFKKAGGYKWSSVLLLLCFFPLVVQVLHDGGPIKVALFTYPLTAILLKKLVQAGTVGKRGLFAVLLSMLWFVALEDKIFFIYLFPSVVLFAIALLPAEYLDGTVLKRQIKYLLLPVLLFGLLGAMLLFSTVKDSTGTSFYLTHVMHENKALLPGIVTALKERVYVVMGFFRYLDFVYYANRNVFMTHNTLRVWVCIVVYTAVVVVLFKNRKTITNTAERTRFFLLLASLGSIVFTFVVFAGVRFGHHYIFMWLPVLAMVCNAAQVRPAVSTMVSGIFVAYSVFSLALVCTAPSLINNSPDLRGEIYNDLDSLNSKQQYIINYSSWNGYFIRELDPRKQELVTFLIHTSRDIKNESERLSAFAKEHHIPVINVSEYPDTQDSLRKLFPAVKSMQHVNTRTRAHSIDVLFFE